MISLTDLPTNWSLC